MEVDTESLILKNQNHDQKEVPLFTVIYTNGTFIRTFILQHLNQINTWIQVHNVSQQNFWNLFIFKKGKNIQQGIGVFSIV